MEKIADQINENQRLDAMFRQTNVSPILTQNDSILGNNIESLQISVENADLRPKI